MGLISLGLGAGLALAMAGGGQPDTGGAFITALAAGPCAYTGYALGMLVAQLTPSARAGTGITALALTGLYLATNVWDEIGALGGVRYLSPFYAFDQSRALVPGYGLHLPSTLALLAAAVLLLVGAARVYRRRDYATGVATPRPRASKPPRRVQRPALNHVWTATLLRQRIGLLTWALAAAAGMAMMAWLEPTVADMWDKFQYTSPPPSRTTLPSRTTELASRAVNSGNSAGVSMVDSSRRRGDRPRNLVVGHPVQPDRVVGANCSTVCARRRGALTPRRGLAGEQRGTGWGDRTPVLDRRGRFLVGEPVDAAAGPAVRHVPDVPDPHPTLDADRR